MRWGASVASIVVAALITSTPAIALADSKKPASSQPWKDGVSKADQAKALALFNKGNDLFEASKYTEAAEKYEAALKIWDHPTIRFNMAQCLMNMRQPLAAYENLKSALRFGADPLGKKLFADAQTYLAALELSIAELTVTTTQPDIKVMLDGQEVLTGVGAKSQHLTAGKHQLVATRAGFVTDSRALDLVGGQTSTQKIELQPEKEKVVLDVRRQNYERRWSWWVPYSVTGAGIATGLIGTGIYLVARKHMNAYDEDLKGPCPSGCLEGTIPQDLVDREHSARRLSGIGVGFWAGAGVLLVTGGVMAIMNRPHVTEERRIQPTVAVSKDFTGVGLTLSLE